MTDAKAVQAALVVQASDLEELMELVAAEMFYADAEAVETKTVTMTDVAEADVAAEATMPNAMPPLRPTSRAGFRPRTLNLSASAPQRKRLKTSGTTGAARPSQPKLSASVSSLSHRPARN